MAPDISIIIPAYNEEESIPSLMEGVLGVMRRAGRSFEVVAVDDGSTDGTLQKLSVAAASDSRVRVLRLTPNSGQSAALDAGFRAARGSFIVVLDADGQNDPADIPAMVARLSDCDVCCGYRAERRDTFSKRIGSRLANRVRNKVLNERIRDTGCTLKAFRAEWVKRIPLQFRGMHRFMPAFAAMAGARIVECPVNHRERKAGRSKYTNWGRLKETVWDLMAVRWMQKRYRRYLVEER